jgi:hypothetical protein
VGLHPQKVAAEAETAKPSADETEIEKARAHAFIDTIETENVADNILLVAPILSPICR